MNLLHLVSAQTLPNLLPIMALRPTCIIQVRSADSRFEIVCKNLKDAVDYLATTDAYRNYCPNFFEIVISEQSPSVDATRHKVGESLAFWPGCVVNLTGGTKQMAIGAYLAAKCQGMPVIYCDTQARQFLPIFSRRNCHPLPQLPSLTEVAARLDVPTFLVAHGIKASHLHSRQATPAQKAFAHCAAELYQQDPASFHTATSAIRNHIRPNGRDPKPSCIQQILATPLPKTPQNQITQALFDAAVDAGILNKSPRGYFIKIPETATSNKTKVRTSLDALQALEGDWFEILVYDAMHASGHFGDLRMGVQSGDSADAMGETDLVAFDLRSLSPVFVSCKTSDAHLQPLEHIFAMRQRSIKFGGTYAKTIFCLLHSTSPGKRSTLEKACKLLQVHLVLGSPRFA